MDKGKLAKHFGVKPEQVDYWRLADEDTVVRVLINHRPGYQGFYVVGIDEIEASTSDKEPLPLPAAISLDDTDYRQLQAMAKEAGIQANQSKEDLISELEVYYALEELEEEE